MDAGHICGAGLGHVQEQDQLTQSQQEEIECCDQIDHFAITVM